MSTPLHDPTAERDACGIGLVADARGARLARARRSRARRARRRLASRRVGRRRRHAATVPGCSCRCTTSLTGVHGAGVAMCFLREPWLRGVVEEACRAERLEPIGWRDVPHDVAALGSTRRRDRAADRPAGRSRRARTSDAELRAYRARRRAELVDGVYIASLSFRTVTYKALCAATQLASFYPDLREPGWAASWAIFHQRFSTNTEPSWERAQPFRLLCHNGEINTIEGNVAWMEARERRAGVDPALSRPRSTGPAPTRRCSTTRSSCSSARGVDVCEALSQLVPPAWQNDPRVGDAERAMRRYHAMLVEPWDGPGRARLHRRRHVRREARPQRAAAAARRGLRRRPRRRRVRGGCRAAARRRPRPPRPARPRAAARGRPAPRPPLRRGADARARARASRMPRWVDETRRFGEQGEPAAAPDRRSRSRGTRSTATRARS